MASVADRQTPVHLWIVGMIALLWNAYGCYDYLMTTTGNEAHLAGFAPEMIAYWESLPTWTTAMWALGVWGGLAGALLLLMRSRFAPWAFALSLIGAMLGLGYQMFMTQMPASMTDGVLGILPWAIILFAAFLMWYAETMKKRGVLR